MASYKNDIQKFTVKEFQTQYYVTYKECAYPECHVMLMWYAPGADDVFS